MKNIALTLIVLLLAGCASQEPYSSYGSSRYHREEAKYSEEDRTPDYLDSDEETYAHEKPRPSFSYPKSQERVTQRRPLYEAESEERDANLVCAEQWVSCGVQPVGSLMQSTQRQSLYSFWKTSCACSESCGCINDLATGEGFARWCDSPNGCSGSDLYGAASGRLQNGRFARINGHLLVSINTKGGLFQGEIHSDGSYQSGIMERIGQDEKFIGLFNPDGSYQSGALYTQGRVILANQFNGSTPLGRVLIGDANGSFVEQDCDNTGCHVVQQDKSPFIADLFSALSQNAAQDIAIRGILTVLGREALLMHPAFRMFAFLQNVFDVVSLANKTFI